MKKKSYKITYARTKKLICTNSYEVENSKGRVYPNYVIVDEDIPENRPMLLDAPNKRIARLYFAFCLGLQWAGDVDFEKIAILADDAIQHIISIEEVRA